MARFAKNLFRWTGARLGISGSAPEAPALPALPAPPTTDIGGMAAIADRRRKRMGMTPPPARSGTQLTGASGITGQAPTERRTLLGS